MPGFLELRRDVLQNLALAVILVLVVVEPSRDQLPDVIHDGGGHSDEHERVGDGHHRRDQINLAHLAAGLVLDEHAAPVPLHPYLIVRLQRRLLIVKVLVPAYVVHVRRRPEHLLRRDKLDSHERA